MYAIGLDIGTTSISAAVIDIDTIKLAESYTIPNRSSITPETEWERIQDPGEIMRNITELADSIIKKWKDIAVIGLTGQMHGILYLDHDGKSISPLYTWQDGSGNQDTGSGESLCTELCRRYSVKSYSGYGLITAVYHHRMDNIPDGAHIICTIPDYAALRLTGNRREPMHASLAASIGLYDTPERQFRKDILSAEGIDVGMLPEVTADLQIVGEYRGIPVAIPIGDNQASFLGSVRHAGREVLLNMGTGGQISVLSEHMLEGDDLETRPFIGDTYLNVGASLCGGRAYAHLADFFRQTLETAGMTDSDPYSLMDSMLESYKPEDPLSVITTFAGTRDHPEKRGRVDNIGLCNFTPADLTYGVLNGMISELYEKYKMIEYGLGVRRTRIIASGNGLRLNRHLRTIAEDMFGMELELSKIKEEAACGAAVAGMASLGTMSWREYLGLSEEA